MRGPPVSGNTTILRYFDAYTILPERFCSGETTATCTSPANFQDRTDGVDLPRMR